MIWITCGNTSNARLKEILTRSFPTAKSLLGQGGAAGRNHRRAVGVNRWHAVRDFFLRIPAPSSNLAAPNDYLVAKWVQYSSFVPARLVRFLIDKETPRCVYMLLVKGTPEIEAGTFPDEEFNAKAARYLDELAKAGALVVDRFDQARKASASITRTASSR